MSIRITLVSTKADDQTFYESTDALKALNQTFVDAGKIVNISSVIDGNTKTFIEEFTTQADRQEFLDSVEFEENDEARRTYNETHSITLDITSTEV